MEKKAQKMRSTGLADQPYDLTVKEKINVNITDHGTSDSFTSKYTYRGARKGR
eukprot:c53148_g1_i1 orf=3-158(-)